MECLSLIIPHRIWLLILLMPEIIIADTSCLIALAKINSLQILQDLYGEIIITPTIATEYGDQLPDWIIVKQAQPSPLIRMLLSTLDDGEVSAIILATQEQDVLVILDDLSARKAAKKLGLKITGTIGIIVKAKQHGIINSAKALLSLLSATDFRIEDDLLEYALKAAGE